MQRGGACRESYSIRDHGLAARLAIRNDVSRVEQLTMLEPAKCAPLHVRLKNTLAEAALMKPLKHDRRDVLPATKSDRFVNLGTRGDSGCIGLEVGGIIYRDGERQPPGVVSDHDDRPNCKILVRGNTVEVDKRCSLGHGFPEPCILRVGRIVATVAL